MDIPFWDFSMDEFAFHDIPDTIQYILETTSAPSLSYIGFSQGTAQAFATLAVHPKLNDQINVFIALAPAMSPAGLSNGIVDALVKASPQVLFLLFGRRSILSSATMWQSILYPPIFVRLIDMGLKFLFGWRARNISASQKLAAYPHLYSFTSTKSVVHWFQIIRTKSFQMYDDDVQPVISLGSVSKYTKVAKFPTRNIKTPIVLVYGGSDSLVDIDVMLKELPAHTMATEIPHYEHLDFLWAREVDTLVFPHVFDALESFCDAEHSKEEYETYRRARSNSLRTGINNSRMLSYMSEEDSSSPTLSGSLMDAEPTEHAEPATTILLKGDESPGDLTLMNPENTSSVYSDNTARKRVKLQQLHYTDDSAESEPHVPKLLPPPTPNSKHAAQDEEEKATAQAPTTPSRIPITSSLPSHSQTPGDTQTPTRFRRSMRSASVGSNLSFETANGKSGISPVGISVGVGRAVGGLLSSAEGIRGSVTSSDENGSGKRKVSGGEGNNKGFGFGGSLRRKK
jgi:lysosomal acid lipase/cholesteryl ester hydrolase